MNPEPEFTRAAKMDGAARFELFEPRRVRFYVVVYVTMLWAAACFWIVAWSWRSGLPPASWLLSCMATFAGVLVFRLFRREKRRQLALGPIPPAETRRQKIQIWALGFPLYFVFWLVIQFGVMQEEIGAAIPYAVLMGGFFSLMFQMKPHYWGVVKKTCDQPSATKVAERETHD